MSPGAQVSFFIFHVQNVICRAHKDVHLQTASVHFVILTIRLYLNSAGLKCLLSSPLYNALF